MDAQGGGSRQSVNRREALRRLAVGGAAAATLPTWVDTLSAFALDHAHTHGQRAAAKSTAAWKPKILTPHQNSTVIALSELIIPQTDTPGAKAANVNQFVDGVLSGAPATERTNFLAGLTALDEQAKREFGTPFVSATADQQTGMLTKLAELQEKRQPGAEFFEAIKSMTIIGYYTSEVGVRQELGDDGTLFFAEFKGCEHPEHRDA